MFNIKGNEYRLVVAVVYRFEAVYIKFVGTHRMVPVWGGADATPDRAIG